MTAESFRHTIKKSYLTDDITNYIIAFIFLGMGIYFLIRLFYDGLPTGEAPWKYMIILVPLIPIAFALYAFWRIPKDYVVYHINSNLPIDEKFKIIEDYLSVARVIRKSVEGNYGTYRYKNKFWSKVNLRVFADEAKLFYNVQGADTSGLKGIIDFGLTRRATKRLTEYLNARL